MSNRDVTQYDGMKYSLQPYGLKSKLLMAFAFFVVTFGGALAVASPAQAAGPEVVTGDWYVNEDETSRKPVVTDNGLVFGPADLIHHVVDMPLADLQPGSFAANPAPDQPSFFSVEVRNSNGAYGTLRWDGSLWSITIGGTNNDGSQDVTPGTFSDDDPVALLTGKVTKWGAFDSATAKVVSFGVGYTQNPPGTVDALVSSVTFDGTTYSFVKPAPSQSPAAPGATVTVTKTVTVTATQPSATPTTSASAPPSSVPNTSATPTTSRTPTLAASPASSDSGDNPLIPWGIGVAVAAAATAVTAGAVGIVRRRRYQGAHFVDDSQTQTMSAVDDDDYGVRDYDPSLGGWAGDTYDEQEDEDTAQISPVKEEPTGKDDTKQIPPVV